MENVRKKALHISGGLSCLLFVYDHHQGPVALEASRVRMSGPTSSTSEIYNTQTSMEKVGLTCYHIILSFPIAPVYYYTVKWFDEWLHSKAKSVIRALVDVKRRPMEDEERFNHLYIEERGKFDEETLVTVNDIRKKSATSQSSNNKYIVRTEVLWNPNLENDSLTAQELL
ncbi:hypothetical protein L1987_45637 [Smallanthus sonchifolius]|uniref:Uncharacterized protein n=1 Tax=Smallanthus sonchifolius TaxID=185202 RepID=A0ACB9FYJ1_9ASTR|nr:hypothetical protein L1987_45637 [Smallanthus sonchifolius]